MPPQFIQWQSHGETKTNKGGMKGALLNTIRQANACSPFFKSTLDYYELGETGKELYE